MSRLISFPWAYSGCKERKPRITKWNIAVRKTQMPPFPNIRRVGLTFDLLTWMSWGSSTHQGLSAYQVWSFSGKVFPSYQLQKVWETDMTFDLGPSDLTINRDHLLIKDYLPTKFEASGAKRCWVIHCTRFGRLTWPLTLTFDLLTWLSMGIIYSSRTIYLPSLKLLGQSVVELFVAQGLRDWHDLWPWPLTYWPDYQ